MSEHLSYRASGVDIEAGDRAVELIKRHASSTFRDGVLGDPPIGGFAGAFAPDLKKYPNPALLSATDGVGTKLTIAQTLDKHDTVGIDLVAMVVDDLVCHGAEPLFLLDYIACGRLVPERIEQIVAGVAEGCRVAGCALLGGETAEHPGVMDPDAYDLAAFAVGIADREQLLGRHRVEDGDAVIGIASSGLHSNGYSLVRRLILEHDLSLDDDLGLGRTLGEELLTPTRIYSPAVLASVAEADAAVHAAAHITGGGIAGNLVRVLPQGLGASLDANTWHEPQIFEVMRRIGRIAEEEMAKTFNLGIGMTMVVMPAKASAVVEILASQGHEAFVIGEVRAGEGVTITPRST